MTDLNSTPAEAHAELDALKQALAAASEASKAARAASEAEPSEKTTIAELVADRLHAKAVRDLEAAQTRLAPVLRREAVEQTRAKRAAAWAELEANRAALAAEQKAIADAELAIEAGSKRCTALAFEQRSIDARLRAHDQWLAQFGGNA